MVAVSAPEPAFQVTEEVVLVPLDLIDTSDRLRPIDTEWAAALAAIMASEGGQKTPVDLYPVPGSNRFRLGPGGHRVEACRLNGWATVKAIIRTGGAADRREAEVSENLWRKDLDPLDRAAFIAELVALQRARAGVAADASPQKIAAAARWDQQLKAEADDASGIVQRAYGFADAVAARLSLSRETIYRDLLLHKGLAPDVVNRLRTTEVGRNAGQLRALAKIPADQQRRAVDLIQEGKAATAIDAIARLAGKSKAAPTPEEKRLNAFIGAFSRMGRREQKAALVALAPLLPKGITIRMGEGGDNA